MYYLLLLEQQILKTGTELFVREYDSHLASFSSFISMSTEHCGLFYTR